MINVEKVYVVHYTRLVERFQKLNSQFRHYGIEAHYVREFDREALTKDQIDSFYKRDEKAYNNTILKVYGPGANKFRPLSKAEISCTIKHLHAIRNISNECSKYGLILEDDVILEDNFVNKFNNYLSRTPSDWDAIFMGNCCGLTTSSPDAAGQIAFKKEHPASKCADGYILRKELASKIGETMSTFHTISDWELGYQLSLHGAKVYWWEPALLSQGSESGLFISTLECSRCKNRGCDGDCV
tara:strand:- start:864 stop:1589 length:726 start_codon:yes stop_codon:yes gene_type:complete